MFPPSPCVLQFFALSTAVPFPIGTPHPTLRMRIATLLYLSIFIGAVASSSCPHRPRAGCLAGPTRLYRAYTPRLSSSLPRLLKGFFFSDSLLRCSLRSPRRTLTKEEASKNMKDRKRPRGRKEVKKIPRISPRSRRKRSSWLFLM